MLETLAIIVTGCCGMVIIKSVAIGTNSISSRMEVIKYFRENKK